MHAHVCIKVKRVFCTIHVTCIIAMCVLHYACYVCTRVDKWKACILCHTCNMFQCNVVYVLHHTCNMRAHVYKCNKCVHVLHHTCNVLTVYKCNVFCTIHVTCACVYKCVTTCVAPYMLRMCMCVFVSPPDLARSWGHSGPCSTFK